MVNRENQRVTGFEIVQKAAASRQDHYQRSKNIMEGEAMRRMADRGEDVQKVIGV
jgi:hypothetical protein